MRGVGVDGEDGGFMAAPMAPPGWFAAKMAGVCRPAAVWSSSATDRARLSPNASVMVVDVVGAETPKEEISDSWIVVGRSILMAFRREGCVSRGQVLWLRWPLMMTRGIPD